jgi:hypothetical protein
MPLMRISKPSPAMAVACTALFVSLGGTSIAAVNYASNAGKVDGKDAVAASASVSRAAGNLVATNSRGPDRGRIPNKFLADTARSLPFGRFIEVTDNAASAPVTLLAEAGIGTLTVACTDQNGNAGVENPAIQVAVANLSGGPLNLARQQGNGAPAVVEFANGTVQNFTVGNANTIGIVLQRPDGQSLVIDAGARQAGLNTPTGACNIFGTAQRINP